VPIECRQLSTADADRARVDEQSAAAMMQKRKTQGGLAGA
jgi:hypothetical protein